MPRHKIITDIGNMDLDVIHKFLTNSYWAKGRTKDEVKTTLQNSYCIGLILDNEQIAFARAVSDKIFFAYLMDVFVLPEYQGEGYGKILMDYLFNESDLKNVKRWLLATKDAHNFYKKYGFAPLDNPEHYMIRKI